MIHEGSAIDAPLFRAAEDCLYMLRFEPCDKRLFRGAFGLCPADGVTGGGDSRGLVLDLAGVAFEAPFEGLSAKHLTQTARLDGRPDPLALVVQRPVH